MKAAASDEGAERRRLLMAGAAFFGVLLVMIAIVALFAGGDGDDAPTVPTTTVGCEPSDGACLAAQRDQGRPGIIPQPNEGTAPQEAGEPGGWEQVALFFVIVAALGVIGALVVRSVRRSAATGGRTPSA